MSDVLKPGEKLEKSPLWKLSTELARSSYVQLSEFPEEEKWGMQSRLRQYAFSITADIAEALGSIDPRDKTHAYGLARRGLFGLKNVYSIAQKSQIQQLDPEIMVKIDKLTDMLDEAINESSKNIQSWYEEFDNKQGVHRNE